MPRPAAKPRSPLDRAWPAFAVLIVASGLAGVSFGRHWDEPLTLDSVYRTYQTGTLLPIHYNYPSMLFWIGNLLAFPRLLASGFDVEKTAVLLRDPSFTLAFRGCLFLLVQLTCLWVYGIARAASLPRWGAILAGLLVGLSFELHYHARWIAPDALASQWVSLSFLLLTLSETSEGPRSFRFQVGAAAAVALAAGTKYTFALFLLPVLGMACFSLQDWKARLSRAALLAGVFGLACLLTTPGALLESSKLFEFWREERHHYAERGHWGYTVVAGWPHFSALVEYLALAGLSCFAWISLPLFLLALVGAFPMMKRLKSIALVGGACLLYALYFSQQVVLIVRNYLVLIPVLALFSAAGAVTLYERWRDERYRRAGAAVLGFGLVVNLVWLIFAAGSILLREKVDVGAEVVREVEASRGKAWLSPGVRELLSGAQAQEASRRAVARYAQADEIYYRYFEVGPALMEANRRGRYRLLRTGPFEVNIDYYPTWEGMYRVLIVKREEFPLEKLPPDKREHLGAEK